MKILIADDDLIPRRFLQAALVKAGHEVVVARDGIEAWQILQRADAPRLAVLDWLMPGLDGVDVCRQVRQRQNAPYVYLLLLTAKGQQEDVVTGLQAGADDYLVKPFDPQELEMRLRAGQRILDLQAALLTSLDQLAQAHHREAEIGARIQRLLLFGQPPGDLRGARIATITRPSQAIAGDFYDFFQLGQRCIDIVIGDVMGKGVPAALLGAAIKSALLRALSHLLATAAPGSLPEPEAIVMQVHREVAGQFIRLGVFATLCYARLDLAQGRLVLVDCGHPKTIYFRRRTGTYKTLQGDNMPLGFSEQEIYRQVVFPLEAGDALVFYSDGVTEARNGGGELFGVDRLLQVIRSKHQWAPEELLEAIHQAVGAFAPGAARADDFTCVAVSLEEAGDVRILAHAQRDITSDVAELVLLRGFVRMFCQNLPESIVDEEALCQLELAVTEAASNIIKHAYQGCTHQCIRVTADAYTDCLVIHLWHGGMAFDPETVKPPAFDGSRDGGFGVYIITHSVDQVRYLRDQQGRHGICLVKKRTTP